MTDIGPNSVGIAQKWPKVGKVWRKLGRFRPNLDQTRKGGSKSDDQVRAKNWPSAGQRWSKFRPNRNFVPTSCQRRTRLDFGQNSIKNGRLRSKLHETGPKWQTSCRNQENVLRRQRKLSCSRHDQCNYNHNRHSYDYHHSNHRPKLARKRPQSDRVRLMIAGVRSKIGHDDGGTTIILERLRQRERATMRTKLYSNCRTK